MGWGREPAPAPMAERDCGCWKPEKPEVVVTQELRERLSEALKAEPAGDMVQMYETRVLHTPFCRIQRPEKRCTDAQKLLCVFYTYLQPVFKDLHSGGPGTESNI